jgi:hypothetical protein
MLIVELFFALTLLCCAVAAVNGGWEGRWIAAMSIATVAIDRAVGMADLAFATSPGFRVLLDGALLVGLVIVMLHSRRYWPIWLTGLQMNGELAHIATWLAGDYAPLIYRGLESVWGIPIMLLMAIGPTLDSRAGIGRD